MPELGNHDLATEPETAVSWPSVWCETEHTENTLFWVLSKRLSMQNKMDEEVCQSTSRRVRVIQVSHGTIQCHGHLHPCIPGIKHYHFKFTHTLNWGKLLYKEKGGTVVIHSDLEHDIQDLESKAIFSTGLGIVIDDKKFSDECRSKNLTNPSNCITVLHVVFKALTKSQSRRRYRREDEHQHAGETVLPPTSLAEVRNKRPPLGSRKPSPQERAARLEKNILEMLWCLHIL